MAEKKNIAVVEVDETLANQIAEWSQARKAVNAIAPTAAREMVLRKEIAVRLNPAPKGTANVQFAGLPQYKGWIAKIVNKLSYRLKNDKGQTTSAIAALLAPDAEQHTAPALHPSIWIQDDAGEWHCQNCGVRPAAASCVNMISRHTLSALIRWEPTISTSEYEKLNDAQKATFADALTITPGAPELELDSPDPVTFPEMVAQPTQGGWKS